jgi:hypothetical protein
LEAFQLVASPDTAPLVADAKRLLTVSYPKLFSRFNHAFHGYEDASELVAAIDAITSDVRAWLTEMPANFKTSSHALSRPKFGLIFVLKNALVRAALGDAKCAAAVAAIERGWETNHKDIVVPKPPPPPQPAVSGTAGGADESEGTSAAAAAADMQEKHYELLERTKLLERALVQLLEKNYDDVVAGLVQGLLSV